MSLTSVDQQKSSSLSSRSSSIRRSSLVVNLSSSTKKRSSVTTLLTSSTLGSKSLAREYSSFCPMSRPASKRSLLDSFGSSNSSSDLRTQTPNGRSSIISSSSINGGYNKLANSGAVYVTGPQSAPPTLSKPSYCATDFTSTSYSTNKSTSIGAARKSIDDSLAVAVVPIVEPTVEQPTTTNDSNNYSNSNPRPTLQVIGVYEVSGSQDSFSRNHQLKKHQQEKEIKSEQSSRRNSKEEEEEEEEEEGNCSPEPIVEVKHTSSSSSNNSAANSSNSSLSSTDCEDSSTKLVRRRTVRRYHRATEDVQQEEATADKSSSINRGSTAELTISINGTSRGGGSSQSISASNQQTTNSQQQQQQQEDNTTRSHYRTRQIGAYYGQAKQQQQQTKTSSSSSSISTSKIAKCSITTNRKSTTSHHHHHHQLISSESSSSSQQQQHQRASSSSRSSSSSEQKGGKVATAGGSTSSSSRNLTDLGGGQQTTTMDSPAAAATTTTIPTTSTTTTFTSNPKRLVRPSLELRLNNQFKDDLFDRATSATTTQNEFIDQRRRIEVQQEEESVHHRQSFSSSTTSLQRDGLRKSAEISSSCSASEAASALLSRRSNGIGGATAMSSDLSASSSRHFKTSLILSGGNTATGDTCNSLSSPARPFLNSEAIFSSPDVRSLVREIGTDFAELENALSSTTQSNLGGQSNHSRGTTSSLSTRLFGRRLLSPVSSQYPAISNSNSGQNLFDEPARQSLLASNTVELNNGQNSDFKQPATGSDYLRSGYTTSYSVQTGGELGGRSMAPETTSQNGIKIRELLEKVQSHTGSTHNDSSNANNKQQAVVVRKDDHHELSAASKTGSDDRPAAASLGITDRTGANDSAPKDDAAQQMKDKDKEDKVHQNHCKAVMTESIERIDQRMSDVCKKFSECRDTKEAIDLLKIMIQMIEKAWSVPVCGDDLGFKLCNSLREAGGLDIILGFIHDSDERALLGDATPDSNSTRSNGTTPASGRWTTVILNAPPDNNGALMVDNGSGHFSASSSDKQEEDESSQPQVKHQQATSAQAKNNNSTNPLRLNLSKVAQSVSNNNSVESTTASPTASQTINAANNTSKQQAGSGGAKDSDSDLLTSDLGLDSTSVESLSYVSAAQVASDVTAPTADSDQLPTSNIITPETKGTQVIGGGEGEEEGVTTKTTSDQNETEDDLDLETDAAIDSEVAAASAANEDLLDEEEASLRKEELVFLSARLLSQCLTSENRNYIVENGLHPIIKLACNFTTMKSTQSHRLLSRSMIMRQSSSSVVVSRQHSKTKLHQKQQQLDSQQQTANLPVSKQQQQTSSVKVTKCDDTQQQPKQNNSDHSDMHAIIGTEILQHLFKHSEDTCSKIISLGGLQAILYACRSSNIETLRHCASALVNLALYGGPDSQQTMIEQKAHVWLFPLAFHEDDNIQYYACLAIVVLVANQEIEADVLKSSTLNLVEPFVTSHEPQRFAESTTSHIHGQSPGWLRKLIPLLESKREEARNLACFHFAMEAYIKKEQGQTRVFKEIGAVEPLRKVGSSPIAIASKFACQALRLIGEKEPHKLSQQVPLWTSEDVTEWVSQIGFERFKGAFVESHVDGDLLLQLDEDMLKTDIGIENGIIRRRFLRELSNLKRIADYSSVDKSGLCSLLCSTGHDFIQYTYAMVQLGVTRDNIHLLDTDQLLRECRVANTIHRMKLAHSIKDLQEKMAVAAASNELSSTDGADQKTLDVFVSYRRSTGSQLASLLKVHLQLRGFSVFIDVERLEAGKFDNNLLDSIKTAKNFILVLSPNALDRCIGDHDCKDWVHKEIVAALASNCNIIPIIDNFHWPDAEQLPEDMRSITYFNGVRWIHDYQDACVDKVERFIRGEINNGAPIGGNQSVSGQSSLQRLPGGGATYSCTTPSICATPSITAFPSGCGGGGGGGGGTTRSPFEADYHPLSFASQYLQQHSQNAPPIRR